MTAAAHDAGGMMPLVLVHGIAGVEMVYLLAGSHRDLTRCCASCLQMMQNLVLAEGDVVKVSTAGCRQASPAGTTFREPRSSGHVASPDMWLHLEHEALYECAVNG